jgi:hypothetical protein
MKLVYKEINDRIYKEFSLNKEYSLQKIINSLGKDYPKEYIKDLLFYLLELNTVEISQSKNPFLNSKIILRKKIIINTDIKEEDNIKLVLSMPPFNKFGFKDYLDKEEITYNSIKEEFIKLIKNSNHEILICSPFISFENIEEIKRLIIKKAAEGIDIKIITREILSKPKSKRFQSLKEFYKEIERLNLEKFVSIKEYHFSKNNKVLSSTHSKLLIIDNKIAYIGSGEIRLNSFEKNFESGIVIQNNKVKELKKIYDLMFSVSKTINF